MKHHAIGPEALPFGMGIGAFGIGLASKFATEPAADTQASPPGIAPCCPRAASGHAAAAPPSSLMNWRRLMSNMGLPSLLPPDDAARAEILCIQAGQTG